MKIFKMKIKREEFPGRTKYTYPQIGWEPRKVVFGPVYEAPEGMSGKNEELIVFGVRDDDAAFFAGANGTAVGGHTFTSEEISRETAISVASGWLSVADRLSRTEAVVLALARIVRGVASEEDYKMIDPDDQTPGINKGRSFMKMLDDALTKF